MRRAYYSDRINSFLHTTSNEIIGKLTTQSIFPVEITQRKAWEAEIDILKKVLKGITGKIYFEFLIPRMGKRIDVLLIIDSILLILEFKVGEKYFSSYAIDQVYDYALDLKNFHEPSHNLIIFPILIATETPKDFSSICFIKHNDKVALPIKTSPKNLSSIINCCLKQQEKTNKKIVFDEWENGRYYPTPTIVEAATALYNGHTVSEISRSDAANLTITSETISSIIRKSKSNNEKSIIFVTGVPGAGKTLIGLNIATEHSDKNEELYSVFLSGNGPLVKVLCEALTRDKQERNKKEGINSRKTDIAKEVKQRIQNVHHFRDEYLRDSRPPIEHVALFDEAQRAWNIEQTSSFMKRKKGEMDFNISEPNFLISCMDRHNDWATVVCLVGGGQEINTGEAGISEWLSAIQNSYPHWNVYLPPRLKDKEYSALGTLYKMKDCNVSYLENLHLAVSIRSFRAENVSLLIKQILDFDLKSAQRTYLKLKNNYPIVLTRDINVAKEWLKKNARGSERYGIIVSSQAERLKPHAIHVKTPIDPIHWFLNDKEDVRSSFFLEDVATEFHIQGLELDWACVTWDADFRYKDNNWANWSFKGNKWQKINKEERKIYQKNAYRVLLTRARQGMVIVVPKGTKEDHTRKPEYYDPTFNYLKQIGFEVI
ncbi:MAG: DUF2075 domain-containing protein [Victivallales bacterium]|nr:DUF2075 domain-containing protein [Victivallales bacterium]MCF7889135.1 DUF2075 domain-containing protein [Victivallales bacterium]